MAWGPPAGSPMHGGSAVGASAAAGLPFAGMPSELAERAQRVLDEEPEHEERPVEFTQVVTDHRRFTLRRFLVPRLLGTPEVDAAALPELLGEVRGHPMACAALATAVLDAELRLVGRSLASHLGAVRDRVSVGVAVGIADTVDELVALVGGYLDEGYRRVKLKIEPGWDVEPVTAVRAAFGDDLALQVDANGAYRPDEPADLLRLDDLGLAMIEQPFAPDLLLDHARFAARARTPVCLDESLSSPGVTEAAVELGACSVVCVKPGRLGGLAAAQRVHDFCVDRDVPVWCGGMLETGIGRAANLALAALPGFTLPSDISASDRYFSRDLTPPFTLSDGTIGVPSGPGIGVEPDLDALEEATVDVELLRR